jgi:hypothetical protein
MEDNAAGRSMVFHAAAPDGNVSQNYESIVVFPERLVATEFHD